MRVEKLVSLLKAKEIAPVHFFTELSCNNSPICKIITDREIEDYKRKHFTKETNYNDSELGIYFPNNTISEMYEIQNKSNFIRQDDVLNDIEDYLEFNNEERILIYGIYTILHEIGHWLYFKASGKTSIEYCLWDSKLRDKCMKFGDKIFKMTDKEEQINFAFEHTEMYKNIPAEKAADEYAFEHIKEKYSLVNEYMNNSN